MKSESDDVIAEKCSVEDCLKNIYMFLDESLKNSINYNYNNYNILDLIFKYTGFNPSAQFERTVFNSPLSYIYPDLINIIIAYAQLTESEHVARIFSQAHFELIFDSMWNRSNYMHASCWMMIYKSRRTPEYNIAISERCGMYDDPVIISLDDLAPSKRLQNVHFGFKYSRALKYYRDEYVKYIQSRIDLY